MIERAPALDARTAGEIWPQVRDRSRGYLGGPFPGGSAAGLGRVFARYLEAILQRLNQAPEKNRLAFYELLGLEPATAQSARAPKNSEVSAGRYKRSPRLIRRGLLTRRRKVWRRMWLEQGAGVINLRPVIYSPSPTRGR